MNRAILMGRLTKDPELRYTQQGTAVVSFTIAVNRRFAKEGQQQADFISCVAWRQTAEFICKYFKKGSMLAVVGSIQTRSWDGQDGKRQYATEVLVDEVHFTGEKAGTGGSVRANPGEYAYPPEPQGAAGGYGQPFGGGYGQQPAAQGAPNFDEFDSFGFVPADDGDLLF